MLEKLHIYVFFFKFDQKSSTKSNIGGDLFCYAPDKSSLHQRKVESIIFPSPIYRGFGLSESFSNHSGWFKKVYMPYVTTDQKIRRITQIIKSSTGNEIKFDYRQKNDSIQSKIFKK
jgi:hypothetical protein